MEELERRFQESIDTLFEIAGGRLYWPLEKALHTDMNYILVSQRGHNQMLKEIFGSSEKGTQGPARGRDGKPLTLSPAAFDWQFDKPREIRIKKR